MIKGCTGAQLRNVFTNEVTICDALLTDTVFDHIFLQCPPTAWPRCLLIM